MESFKRKLTIGFTVFIIGIFIFIAGLFLKSWYEALLIIIGLLLSGFGIYLVFITNTNRRNFLKTNGLKIQSKIKYISVEVSGPPFPLGSGPKEDLVSFKILCEGKGINNDTQEYKSSDMVLQPDIKIDNNSLIDVYVNPQDQNDYFVDISKIPVKNYMRFDRPLSSTTVYYRSLDGLSYQKVE